MEINMIQHNQYNSSKLLIVSTCCVLLFTFMACKKADNFYAKENQYPQINNTAAYAYAPAYVVGDTMLITGRLQPKNNLQISIGGIQAQVVKVDSVLGADVIVNQQRVQTYQDQVGILITAGMIGDAREVKITSSGYSTQGAAIDVYSLGGEGSFNNSLGSTQLTTLSNTYQFLYAVTGKGDVYYFAKNNAQLWHIKKDGKKEFLYDLSRLNINVFLAGGVDPQEQNLYFSVQLATGYALYQLNLQTQALTVLNQSAELSSPYEGAISQVHLMVTGIYPDAKGNLYLGIGLGNQQASPNFVPDAIARYTVSNNRVQYVFNAIRNYTYPGMPGLRLPTKITSQGIRVSPDENLLYVIGDGLSGFGVDEFNLEVGVLVQDFETLNPTGTLSGYNVIGPFSGLKINFSTSIVASQAFGYLPMPNQRLQTLLFQDIDGSVSGQTGNIAEQLNFPKWTVFDFANKRTYAYALGLFQTGNGQYNFGDIDELLNYDEAGNLYMTANGKSYLIQTQPAN